ncbi:MAG: sensor histidine kinase, partial [Oceanococcus sp.]
YIVTQRVEQVGWLYEITDYLTESLPAALLLSFIISLSVSRAIFRRVDVINTASIDIMRGDLSRRIDVGNGNADLDTMANNLNAMLDRIQQLVKGIREVTDGIAHDLRSPLTRLRSRLEVTLLETRKAEEYQQTIQQGIEDADGLIHTFNALLSIAQVEAGNHRSEWTQVNLAEIVEDVADLYSAVAEDNGQSFDLALDAQAQVLGSRNLLAQMVGNIIENAIKYAPTDGHINVAVKCREGQCVLEVSDNGPGIPIHERERALERFVRLDNSRHSPGNGLGLSMVKAVAHLHHAELVLSDANPGLKVQIIFA